MSDTPGQTPADTARQVQEFIDNGDIVGLTQYLQGNVAGFYQQDLDAINSVLAETFATLSPATQEDVLEAISSAGLSEAVGPGLEGADQQPGPVGSSMVPDDPVAAQEWYDENYAGLSPAAQTAVNDDLANRAVTDPSNGAVWAGLAARGESINEPALAAAETGALADARQEAVDYIAENLSPSQVDLSQFPELPDTLRPDGMSDQEYASWLVGVQNDARAQAEQQAADEFRRANPGTTEEEAAAVAESQFAGLATGAGDVPVWMLQMYGGGATWRDPVLRQRIVDYWNDQYGTPFTDFAQVAPFLESTGPTAAMQEFVESVMADQEPVVSRSIRIPFVNGAQSLTYSESDIATLHEMGFDDDAITRLVRLNALNAGVDAIHPGPIGQTADIFTMAALMRYYGGGEEAGRFNQIGQDINALELQLGLQPEEFRNMTFKERQQYIEDYASRQVSPAAAQSIFDLGALAESLLRSQGRLEEGNATTGVLLAGNNLQRALATYNGDPILAFISSIDANLAQRIAATGGDLEKLTGQDNAAAMSILDRGGISARGSTFWEQLGGSGGQIGQNVMAYLNYFDFAGGGAGGGGAGGAGPVRRMIDPVSIKEQLQAKFADLMLPDIPDDVVKSVQNMLQGQLDAAPEGMNFDVSARILDWIHGRPEYGELYGKKPQGMSEAEYQSQFQAGVSDMLGAQADPEAVKAGLRGNDYQAAVGTAAIGGLAGRNSRLMGRWAQAKQTLDKFS